MPTKSVRDMNFLERKHHSLSTRMFRIIMVFSMVLSLIAGAFGFYLYHNAAKQHYVSLSTNLARTSAILMEAENVEEDLKTALDIYCSMPEEQRKNPENAAYLDAFSGVRSSRWEELRSILHLIEADNDASSLYIAAYDAENDRLVYLVDSDRNEATFCPPGYWEDADWAPDADKHIYAEVPVDVTHTERYGYLCTGWSSIGELNGMPLLTMVDLDLNHATRESLSFLWQYIFTLFFATLILDILIVRKMKKTVVNPINALSNAAQEYRNASNTSAEGRRRYFKELGIRTGDEIENLALTIEDMEADIGSYVERLLLVTAEKERIGAELGIAKAIQEGMIPSIFPAFPGRTEFDLYALMDTAKEVGGDFYDYFLIDDDHLGLVMADVSGKGVPAALFMMASKILIANYAALQKTDPGEILREVNNRIVRNNKAEMFVTVWLGILELSTGIVKAANAGHEFPAICKKDGSFELFRDPHGFVVGGMEGMKYKSYEFRLAPGDTLFLYTDGVPEATNADKELFGVPRMLQSLSSRAEAPLTELLHGLKEDTFAFVGDAPQFDDITMLALRYAGKEKNVKELTVNATVENIPAVTEFVDEELSALDCPLKAQMQIDVAIDELFGNIAHYAYDPNVGPATVRVSVEEDPLSVVITFIDQGKPYDPLKNANPDVSLSAEEREVGGLGIFLVKKTMDDVTYEYKDGKNILTIKKRMGE